MNVADRDLASWLIEFGYLRPDPSRDAVRDAFRVARNERGALRLARELERHEARRAIQNYTRWQRSCRT